MIIWLDGQVPAQKNEKRIAINRRTGKPFPMTSPAVKAWKEDVAVQLKGKPSLSGRRVGIYYTFFVKDNRRRDLDNMIASVNDALVHAGIISDDSWQILEIDGAKAKIDKNRQGVAIIISELEEEE